MSFLLLLMSTLQQNWRKGQNKFCLEARRVAGSWRGQGKGGEMAHLHRPSGVIPYVGIQYRGN
jgi:hypothetical protein